MGKGAGGLGSAVQGAATTQQYNRPVIHDGRTYRYPPANRGDFPGVTHPVQVPLQEYRLFFST